MYADRAITPSLFQWESQSTTSERRRPGSATSTTATAAAPCTCSSARPGNPTGTSAPPPYLYAGPVTYVSHTGDRPMRIIWQLDHDLPADVFHAARVAAG